MRNVLDRRLISHLVGAVEQIDAGASGNGLDKDTSRSLSSNMADHASLPMIQNLEGKHLSPSRSSLALADVPPWRPSHRRRQQSHRLRNPYRHH